MTHPGALPSDLGDVVLRLCEDLATPRACTVAILYRYGEWDQLSSLKAFPNDYVSAKAYKAAAIASNLLRKLEELPTTVDRAAVAERNFEVAESACYSTNKRLEPYLFGMLDHVEDEAVHHYFSDVRQYLTVLLGSCPGTVEGRFGPGATFGDRGRFTTVPDKMSSRPTLTSSALPFLFFFFFCAWATACASEGRDPEFIRGNRFTTVPKDCTKDRGICIEPSVNLFYQLGYGKIVRSRLLASGINLKHGQEIHRRVACEASIRGHLSTIDLSNASDTICTNLVSLVLPERWHDALNMLRSSHTFLPKAGKWKRLEKFSSMGNGYTFELETAIFLGICAVACEYSGIKPIPGENIFVYGDDIIVPTEATKTVLAALRLCGFTPNVDKTFVDGPFRESCGGDYFEGVDVRPYFLKQLPYEPQHYIAMANGLRRLGNPDSDNDPLWPPIRRAWFRIMDAIPSNIRRLRGPSPLGDLVIHDREENWNTRSRSSIRYVRVYRVAKYRKIAWHHFSPHVTLAGAVYMKAGRSSGIVPRDAVCGHKIGWVPYS